MRRNGKTALLLSTAAIMTISTPATAQDVSASAQDVAGPSHISAAAAQSAEVSTESGPPLASDQELSTNQAVTSAQGAAEEIVVYGIRGSIQRAQDIKRRAPAVVEAITLEDLGKFTDAGISDALSRVPGVTINRNARSREGGDGVTIRGLGPAFVRSTVNGRDLFGIAFFGGGGGRLFDFEAVPPEILAGVTVYKSPTASLPELGLAGGVDLKTLRPLDFKPLGGGNFFGSASITGAYEINSKKVSPRFGGVVGVKLLDETLGLYISGVHSRQRTEQTEYFHYNQQNTLRFADASGAITVIPGVQLPLGWFFGESQRKYTKNSLAAGLQWEPSQALEVNVDFLFNKFKMHNFNPQSDFILGSVFNGKEVIQPGGAEIRGGELINLDTRLVTGGGIAYQRAGFQDITNSNQFYNGGINVAWSPVQDVRLTADYSHGKSRYTTSWLYPFLNNGKTGFDVVYDGSGRIPEIELFPRGGFVSTDPSPYGDPNHFAFDTLERTRRDTLQLGVEGRASSAIVIKAGTYYSETKRSYLRAFNLPTVPVVTAGIFEGTQRPPLYNVDLPRLDPQAYCAVNASLCNLSHFGEGSFVGGFPTSPTGAPGESGFDPASAYYVKETNLAFYAQADIESRLGNLPYRANAGVRAVKINEDAKAFQGTEYRIGEGKGPIDPSRPRTTAIVNDSHAYWEVLPAANVTFKPRENVNLRLAAGRTISLGGYDQLSPKGTAIITVPDANGNRQPNLFSGGNTALKPTSAWNYDFTAEYYTDNRAAFIASLFYKDVRDLITNRLVVGSQVPGQSELFNSTVPINANKGFSYGFEVGATLPMEIITPALSGFGVQANYTFVESEVEAAGEKYQFPGSSKHNVNLSGYFETDDFSARVAYNFRSAYLDAYITNDHSIFNRAQGTVDFSVSKKLSRNLEAVISGANINRSKVSSYYGSGKAFRGFFERATIYSAALRATF